MWIPTAGAELCPPAFTPRTSHCPCWALPGQPGSGLLTTCNPCLQISQELGNAEVLGAGLAASHPRQDAAFPQNRVTVWMENRNHDSMSAFPILCPNFPGNLFTTLKRLKETLRAETPAVRCESSLSSVGCPAPGLTPGPFSLPT